jgi:hypothetical protein
MDGASDLHVHGDAIVCGVRDAAVLCHDSSIKQTMPMPWGSVIDLAESCIIRTGGEVLCQDRGNWKTAAMTRVGIVGARKLSGRGNYTCAVIDDGSVMCRGRGPLGAGEPSNGPFKVHGLTSVGAALTSDSGR